MNHYKAPDAYIQGDAQRIKVFLCGSIEMGKAEKWQEWLAGELRSYHIDILDPRRDTWDTNLEPSEGNQEFREQVEWELNALEQADTIAVYFDPNTRSPITLLELGLYAQSGKAIVCCPKGFFRRGNVAIVCEQYGIPLYEYKDDFLAEIKRRLNIAHTNSGLKF